MINCCQPLLLASGRFFFRVRNALFPMLLLIMVVATRPAQFLGNPELDPIAVVIGALLLLGGQTLRLIVIGYAYIGRGGKDRKVFANHLVTRGFYSHSRNPMYVGNYSIVLGFTLIYGSAWGYAFMAPFFAYIYLAITTAEEAFLQDKFGASYDEYTRRVNRFIPNLRGLGASLAEFSYDWRRALVKEYGTICFALLSLLTLLAWKIAYVYGYNEHQAAVRYLCAGCIPVLVFYGIVRFLKKTDRLRPAREEETEQPVARP
jgi:protein-S-isoprenylcysteine O-methyltransferase Ste14